LIYKRGCGIKVNMSPPLRIEYPGAYCHVMNRGLTGQSAYVSDSDSKRVGRNIKRGACILVCLSLVFFLTSCIGDGVARVRGKVVSKAGEGIKDCVLELYTAEDNKLIGEIDMSYDYFRDGQFELSFTIAPFNKKYYMIIKCEGYSSSHNTGVYEMWGTKYSENPLDLGRIVLEK
jgi:hypothetical protein